MGLNMKKGKDAMHIKLENTWQDLNTHLNTSSYFTNMLNPRDYFRYEAW